ncbi:GerMN domain-containing protein [Streptomyces sp. AV19]|uniref:GerMN domain-containing protein n=1 Tax=Streptomyces sp. AV19 TaxID=2793068 RepID=UPI0018FED639|nr:GerMN domain-containing protein [Streptomyces sp. AV19]MBH1937750.1 GerMN domain-containing protein [Streptomyces sp. AV19]MDG4536419.1 GerMN domain-containing protein [Streptomyces sp. AV19]
MRRHLPALVLVLSPLAGCGVDDTGPGRAGAPASGLPLPGGHPAAALHLYFSSPVGLERVSRLYGGPDAPQAAMDRLVQGPDPAERTRGLVTFVPPGAPAPTAVTRERDTVDVYLPPAWTDNRTALRQVVCTAADAVGTGAGPEGVRVRLHRAEGGPVTETCAR